MLIAFIYGEIVLANLVFNNTDINSLLALLPIVIVSGFAWFGRSFIFDVREDIKELSKKESVEEKILNSLNEQVKFNVYTRTLHSFKFTQYLSCMQTQQRSALYRDNGIDIPASVLQIAIMRL